MFILDGFWDAVGGAILDALRSLMLSLCGIIYKLIIFFFDIFMKLGNAQLLRETTISEFYERVGLLLGLFMIFRVTFSFVQYVINPDMMTDKNKGVFNVVKRIIVVVILLGVTRPIFNMAYDAQNKIIESNVIPKVITGKNVNSSESGANLAWYTFSSFYSFDKTIIEKNPGAKLECPEYRDGGESSLIKGDFMVNHSLDYAYNCVNYRVEIEMPGQDKVTKAYLIDFDGHGIIAVITGGLILWMILTYTLQVAIRVVQLAYLQLIAPIPIISYLAPKGEDTLNKWFKQCITTYIDFFLRIAILYFVIFIINLIISNDYTIFKDSLGDTSRLEMEFINVIIIIALLVFANKVPKLLKEIFPSLGGGAASFDFGLDPRKTLNNTLAARAIGAVGGAIGAGASNAVHGYMNMRKTFKDNGGWKSGKAWATAAGAGAKGIFSIVGGQLGGARAGLKTKDIGKVGEAVKTANKNRTERELKAEAGYHWYNPLPAMGDKILEFSGDRSTEDAKKRLSAMRDANRYEKQLNRGKQIFDMVDGELADSNGNVKTGVFHNAEYVATLTEKNKSKDAVKKANAAVETAEREVNAIYNNQNLTGEERKNAIEIAELRLKNAKGNLKAAEGKLKIDEEKHAKNQEIYSEDKEIEILFNYYADTHKKTKDINDGVDKLVARHGRDDSNGNTQSETQENVDEMQETQDTQFTDNNVNQDNSLTNNVENEQRPVISEEQIKSLINEEEERTNKLVENVMQKNGKGLTPKQYSEISVLQSQLDDIIRKCGEVSEQSGEYAKLLKEYERVRLAINNVINEKE